MKINWRKQSGNPDGIFDNKNRYASEGFNDIVLSLVILSSSSILILLISMPNIYASTTLLIFLGSYKLFFGLDLANKQLFIWLFKLLGFLP